MAEQGLVVIPGRGLVTGSFLNHKWLQFDSLHGHTCAVSLRNPG